MNEGAANKQCTRCGETKPADAFPRNKKDRPQPYRTICHECDLAYSRSPRRRAMALASEHAKRGTEEHRRQVNEKSRQWRKRYPEKDRAKNIVRDALKNGTLVRPAFCEQCSVAPAPKINGASRIQGHHPDYRYPLKVLWLCEPCHMREHRRAP